MDWIEFRITTTNEAVDALSDALTSMGASGVAIEDPYDIVRYKDDENNWDYVDESILARIHETDVVVKVYFPIDRNPAEIESNIRQMLDNISIYLDAGKAAIERSVVREEDWANAWKKFYKPLKIGKNIVIKPTWEEYNPKDGEIIIEMDPGMAFGTGTHETTRMCGELLEKYLKKGDVVYDVGCGTGILSIIALKLGADRVEAVDIDETAVKIAVDNALRNGCAEKITVKKGTIDSLPVEKADIVVANIIANVIIDISNNLKYYLKANGLLIASGIIKDRELDVLEAYESKGYVLTDKLSQGEWLAMVFRCPDTL